MSTRPAAVAGGGGSSWGPAPELPGFDGDVRHYRPASGVRTGPLMIYVNGIQNSPADHAATAQALADALGIPVRGVYNASGGTLSNEIVRVAELTKHACKAIAPAPRPPKQLLDEDAAWWDRARRAGTDAWEAVGDNALEAVSFTCVQGGRAVGVAGAVVGFATDVGQSADEYLRLASNHVATDRISTLERIFRADAGVRATLGATIRNIAKSMHDENERCRVAERIIIGSNRASLSLFRLLRQTLVPGRRPRIVAHSQGNLVTSTALAGLAFVRQYGSLPITVFPVASPAYAWPELADFDLKPPIVHGGDLIPLLGGAATGLPGTVRAIAGLVTTPLRHGMDHYIADTSLLLRIKADLGIH